MAALRPCPVRITAPASSNLTRSQPRYGSILPLYRSNTLQIRAPLDRSRTLLKISNGIRAHSGAAGQPVNPDPEERFMRLLTPEEKKIWDKVKEVAKGPPDMPFREEIDILYEYWGKARDEVFHNKSILGAALAYILCSRAHHAAVLASKVVDCAALRLGLPDEISLHTTTQLLGPTVNNAMRCTQVCVTKMTGTLQMALRHMQGAAARAPDDDK